jgi:uncharacterized protein (DUF427 family)
LSLHAAPSRNRFFFLQFALEIQSEENIREREILGGDEMPKATWGGKVIADSNRCIVVEGNQYFPASAVKKEFLKPSPHTSECPWKGTAHYYNLEIDGMKNENAAWYYPHPKPAAAEIKDHVAFWKGVEVEA